MLIVRPIARDDLDQLEQLAQMTSFGLTTLPKDRDLLLARIEDSVHGFATIRGRPRGDPYLFVLEDLGTGKLLGTSGVVSKVGGFDPHYTYRIETSVHESEMLKVRKEIKTLHLSIEHNGPCEIGSLFLVPEARGGGTGRLLSLGRLLFMAEHTEYFDPVVIAEMRGVIDDHGHSPFWDALGRHFFDIEFPTADYLSVVNKRFIADLMPRHPIYIPLLPPEAQAVIGKVHEKTRPALRILEQEGFSHNGEVDIFEAGPVVSCPLDRIRTVRESRRFVVGDITDDALESPPHVIATTGPGFRAAQGPTQALDSSGALPPIRLLRVTALGLGVKVGDTVRACTLRPGT